MTILNKLNGWQRLWLMCAVIWAIPVVTFTASAFPTETVSEITTQWANAKIELMRKYHGSGETLAEFRQQRYDSASDEEIVHPIKNRHAITITFIEGEPHTYQNVPDEVTPDQVEQRALKDFPRRKVSHIDRAKEGFDLSTSLPADEADAIDMQYKSRLTNLGNKSQLGVVAFGFLAWILPAIVIYLLGFAVRWVYVGFRSNSG